MYRQREDWLQSIYQIIIRATLFLLVAVCLATGLAYAQSQQVRAVLFFSPTCGHCHKVMTEDLPPLLDQYGDSLQIVGINITTPEGQRLYQAAVQRYDIPEERLGVPCLVVGENVLVGSIEIPEQFPNLISAGLSAGGIAWPDIPGLEAILVAENLAGPEVEAELSPVQKFSQDLVGNSLSVFVLVGMLVSLVGVGYRFSHSGSVTTRRSDRLVPLLSILGLSVALYLSYVELTQTQPICGPVGDCNTVQQSPYAVLFGVLPVGALGALGYLLIIFGWGIEHYGPVKLRRYAALAIWGMAWIGVLFSIYLTFLEPFVIGATCAWCIASAVLMTLILWASTKPAREAWDQMR